MKQNEQPIIKPGNYILYRTYNRIFTMRNYLWYSNMDTKSKQTHKQKVKA